MNKKNMFGAMMLGVLLLAGCSKSPQYIDPSDSRSYASMGLDYHDIEQAAIQSVDSLLQSAYVKDLSHGRPKVLMISSVVNDTMQIIDTDQLSRKIVRDMRKSGKFLLTLAVGDKQDRGIASRGATRDNDEFDQHTTIEKGTLKAPELSLSAKIVQKNTKVGSKQRTDYFFLLTLTNLKDGLVVWDDEVNIIKLGSNSSVSW